jgi:UDP-2,3-diacylglucosamine hydrolase
VCVCGDLFDFWFEYKHAVVNRYFNVLFKFSQLVESGVKVHYIAGNHDFWMRDFLTNEVGVAVHRDIFKIEINTQRLFVRHGDGIDRKDKGYRLLKKVLQNSFAIKLYRLIHPDIGVPIAHFASNLSRDKSSHKCFRAAGDYQEYAQNVLDQGYDIVVLAHTHQPLVEKLNGGYYLNPGDWIIHFTYGIVDGKNVQVKKWDD